MTRTCGTCTACCKAMAVPDMLPKPKPMHKWCKHCNIGHGCQIYETRPSSCREFDCFWLQDKRGILPDSLRPDRSKVVLQPTMNGGLIAHCDPQRPLAWRHVQVFSWLRKLAARGYPIAAEAGSRHWIITGTTDWEVTADCKQTMPNGMVMIRCPDDVKQRIGLYVRPECKDLGQLTRISLTTI
jgi:hypothetical protein